MIQTALRLALMMVGVATVLSGCGSAPQHPQDIPQQQLECTQGDPAACLILADRLRHGHSNVDIDLGQARDWYQMACDGGSARGCARLGAWYSSIAWGLEATQHKALELLRKGCAGQEAEACMLLARRGYYGQDGERDKASAQQRFAQARALAQASCEAGQAEACVLMWTMAKEGYGARASLPQMQDYARKACALGDMSSCMWLGRTHGPDLSTVQQRGMPIAERACLAGRATSCVELASIYRMGWDGRQDLAKAHRLLVRACDGGHAEGCQELFTMSRLGLGTAISEAAADKALGASHDALKLACDGGHAQSCHDLAKAFLDLKDNPEAGKQARIYAGRSCDLNYAPGCSALSNLFEKGQGGSVDEERAVVLQGKSDLISAYICDAGHSRTCRLLHISVEIHSVLAELQAMKKGGEDGALKPPMRLDAEAIFLKGHRFDVEACEERGVLGSCRLVASDWAQGDSGITKNMEGAQRLADMLCNEGERLGCMMLVTLGHGEDEAAQRQAFERACTLHHSAACEQLAQMQSDPSQARELRSKACRLGLLSSCQAIGLDTLIREGSIRCYRGFYAQCHTVATALLEQGQPAAARRFDTLACEGGQVKGACARIAARGKTTDAPATPTEATDASAPTEEAR
ncbi:MAG: hypothetical protein AAFX99_04545 [Myxococcota bacterium]